MAPSTTKCAAINCKRTLRKKWFCLRHWVVVTTDLRKALLEHYVVGQDGSGKVSPGFRVALSECVKHIAFLEGVLVKVEPGDERREQDDPAGWYDHGGGE